MPKMTYIIQLRPYLANTSWILASRVATLTSAFFVTAMTARHLGPAEFGILSYAISLTGLFAITIHLGLSGLTVREMVRHPTEIHYVMGTVLAMKFSAALLAFSSLTVVTILTESTNTIVPFVILLVGIRLFLNPLQTFHQWFEARVEARYIAFAQSISAVVCILLTLILVYLNADIIFFAINALFHFTFTEVLVLAFFLTRSSVAISTFSASLARAKTLFKQGWPIFIGSVFAVIYLKADQVMLRWLVGDHEVGQYAVAAALSEAWYIVPVALVTSFFPKLIGQAQENSGMYRRNLQHILDALLLIAVFVAVLVTVFAQTIVAVLFGDAYLRSADILTIHVWGAIFIFLRAAFSKWILIEEQYMLSLITQGSGAVINIALNLILIPYHGGLGAAYATVIAYAFASYVSLFFFPQSRGFAFLMTRTFFLPPRLAHFLWQRAAR